VGTDAAKSETIFLDERSRETIEMTNSKHAVYTRSSRENPH